jgi:steroid delta-isomerase-like uncharacterized protein
MTPLENNKAVLRAFVAAINARDWPAVESLAAPDIVRHSATAGSPRGVGRDSLLAFLRGEAEAFPDSQETIEFTVAEGDLVAARLRFRGTQLGQSGPYPPTGRVLDAGFLGIFRIADGKVAEVWVEFDNLNSLIQLGHYAPPG